MYTKTLHSHVHTSNNPTRFPKDLKNRLTHIIIYTHVYNI